MMEWLFGGQRHDSRQSKDSWITSSEEEELEESPKRRNNYDMEQEPGRGFTFSHKKKTQRGSYYRAPDKENESRRRHKPDSTPREKRKGKPMEEDSQRLIGGQSNRKGYKQKEKLEEKEAEDNKNKTFLFTQFVSYPIHPCRAPFGLKIRFNRFTQVSELGGPSGEQQGLILGKTMKNGVIMCGLTFAFTPSHSQQKFFTFLVNVVHKKYHRSQREREPPRYEHVRLEPTYLGQSGDNTLCSVNFPVPIETLYRKDKLSITLLFRRPEPEIEDTLKETTNPLEGTDAREGFPKANDQACNPPSPQTMEILCEVISWSLLLFPMGENV